MWIKLSNSVWFLVTFYELFWFIYKKVVLNYYALRISQVKDFQTKEVHDYSKLIDLQMIWLVM